MAALEQLLVRERTRMPLREAGGAHAEPAGAFRRRRPCVSRAGGHPARPFPGRVFSEREDLSESSHRDTPDEDRRTLGARTSAGPGAVQKSRGWKPSELTNRAFSPTTRTR